eukprot:1951812-Prymnesium_polylepis.2
MTSLDLECGITNPFPRTRTSLRIGGLAQAGTDPGCRVETGPRRERSRGALDTYSATSPRSLPCAALN